jgi:glycosyltransferase involved in cell wall biosynthesis
LKSTSRRPTILTLVDYFEPGYKAGGPITTIRNSIDYLKDSYDFKVVTSDRDLGDTEPYPLRINQWNPGVPKVLYVAKDNTTAIVRAIADIEYDILYLNSFFSFRFSILPVLWMRLKGAKQKVILAPRGEFSKGALSLKRMKKSLYISLAKCFGIYKNVTWQASSDEEKNDISRQMGSRAVIVKASDLPASVKGTPKIEERDKAKGRLRLVFLSRISKMKNVDFALSSLRHVQGDVSFHIYGPIEDRDYWGTCQAIIETLPEHISVEYRGSVLNSEVKRCLELYDLFYLPTLGEGFGHAIFEAMQSACPVLLSDRTPWNSIASEGGGTVIPLEKPEDFSQALQYYVDMDKAEYEQIARNALKFSSEYMQRSSVLVAHRSLFEGCMQPTVGEDL